MKPPDIQPDHAQPGWALLGLTNRRFTGALAGALHDHGLASIPVFTTAQLLLRLHHPPEADFAVVVVDRRLPPRPDRHQQADLIEAIRGRSNAPILAIGEQPPPDPDVDVTLPLETPAEAVAATASILAHQRPRPHTQLRCGPLLLNRSTWQVWWKETPIQLTSQQFQLLHALADAAGTTVTPHQLAHALYKHHLNGDTAAIRAHIGRLRRRLHDITPLAAEAVLTVRGHGYRLVIPQPLADQHASADRSP